MNVMSSRTTRHLLCAVAVLTVATAAQALTINPTFTNSADGTWDATRIGVVSQAIAEWETIILNDETVNIEFDFVAAGSGSYLGQWDGHISYYLGDDIRPWYSGVTHKIHFNADRMDTELDHYLWFDSSPATDGDLAFEVWDALSVARHELGHAMGFASGFYEDNKGAGDAVDLWGALIDANNIFDADGLNVAMNGGDWGHVLDSGSTEGDLMVAALVNGQRHTISDTDIAMLATAYGYSVIPEPASLSVICVGGLAMLIRRRRAA